MSAEIFGTTYVFGFDSITAPSIGGGFVMTELSLDRAPEYFQTATNGAGQVGSMAKPPPVQDEINFTAKGYITDLTDFDTTADSFTWNGRFYIIKTKGEPFKEKDYLTVEIKGVSYYNVTSESV